METRRSPRMGSAASGCGVSSGWWDRSSPCAGRRRCHCLRALKAQIVLYCAVVDESSGEPVAQRHDVLC